MGTSTSADVGTEWSSMMNQNQNQDDDLQLNRNSSRMCSSITYFEVVGCDLRRMGTRQACINHGFDQRQDVSMEYGYVYIFIIHTTYEMHGYTSF